MTSLPTPLIDVDALARALPRAELVIVDCRFDLMAPSAGRDAWLEAHIPGAVYAHLDHDLSGPPSTDHGRHPLPPPARLCEMFGALGIGNDSFVVAYDDGGGMVAARLWWMLRYMGHEAVAVLNGGWQAWVAAGQRVAQGVETAVPRRFTGTPGRERLVTLDEVGPALTLLDARAAPRYRGEQEHIDPHPGHIPGARNHCWQMNLGADGRFAPAAELGKRLAANLGATPDARTVHYCGSGVSACHNVLAQVAAGLPEPRLYVGSWSEWCRDPGRPRALGGESNA